MPECAGCGAFVTEDYVRVFKPDDVDRVRACPDCPDLIRDGADVREARSQRFNDEGNQTEREMTDPDAGGVWT